MKLFVAVLFLVCAITATTYGAPASAQVGGASDDAAVVDGADNSGPNRSESETQSQVQSDTSGSESNRNDSPSDAVSDNSNSQSSGIAVDSAVKNDEGAGAGLKGNVGVDENGVNYAKQVSVSGGGQTLTLSESANAGTKNGLSGGLGLESTSQNGANTQAGNTNGVNGQSASNNGVNSQTGNNSGVNGQSGTGSANGSGTADQSGNGSGSAGKQSATIDGGRVNQVNQMLQKLQEQVTQFKSQATSAGRVGSRHLSDRFEKLSKDAKAAGDMLVESTKRGAAAVDSALVQAKSAAARVQSEGQNLLQTFGKQLANMGFSVSKQVADGGSNLVNGFSSMLSRPFAGFNLGGQDNASTNNKGSVSGDVQLKASASGGYGGRVQSLF